METNRAGNDGNWENTLKWVKGLGGGARYSTSCLECRRQGVGSLILNLKRKREEKEEEREEKEGRRRWGRHCVLIQKSRKVPVSMSQEVIRQR